MEIVQLPGAALRAFPFLLPLSGEKIRQGPKMKPELERMPNATVSFCNMSPVDTAWPSHTPILLSMYLYIYPWHSDSSSHCHANLCQIQGHLCLERQGDAISQKVILVFFMQI